MDTTTCISMRMASKNLKALGTKVHIEALERLNKEKAFRATGIYEASDMLSSINEVDKIEWENEVGYLSKHAKSWVARMFDNAKHKSRKKGVEFSIEYDEFVSLLLATGGACSITGMKFTFNKYITNRTSPYQPSLDRVDSNLGYTTDNCRIVCYCVNLAMNQWGDEVLDKMCKSYVAKRYTLNG